MKKEMTILIVRFVIMLGFVYAIADSFFDGEKIEALLWYISYTLFEIEFNTRKK